jgi:hypothetical protein
MARTNDPPTFDARTATHEELVRRAAAHERRAQLASDCDRMEIASLYAELAACLRALADAAWDQAELTDWTDASC